MARRPETEEYAEHPELAVVALVSMLARFPWCASPVMSDSILRHLELIAADARHPGVLRAAASRIADEWRTALSELEAEDTVKH